MSDLPVSGGDEMREDNWHHHLGAGGSVGLDAQRQLHELLLKATRLQVWRLRHQLPGAGTTDLDDLAQQAADDAHLAVLRKIDTFEGRSRFSTWVYKFGILHAGVAIRRQAWRHHEVALSETLPLIDPEHSPASIAEGGDLRQAVQEAIASALMSHQRQVVIALLIDDVPIDVLAERMDTTRNALYKNVHDARKRLCEALIASGHLDARSGRTPS